MRRSRPLLLLATVLAVVLAACGGQADQDAYGAFIEGVEAAADAGSARIELSSTSSIGGQEVSVDGEGVSTFDGSAAEFTVESGFAGQGFTVTTRILDQTVYLQSDVFAQLLGTDAWIEVTPQDLQSETGLDLEQLFDQAQQAQSSFDQLMGVTEDSLEVVGEEDIDGLTTTHYRGTVDTEQALAALTGDAAGLEAYFETLPDSYDIDVWLDDQDRPRRIVTDVTMPVQGQSVANRTQIDFTEYGVEVDISAPDDTVNFSELADQLGGGPGS